MGATLIGCITLVVFAAPRCPFAVFENNRNVGDTAGLSRSLISAPQFWCTIVSATVDALGQSTPSRRISLHLIRFVNGWERVPPIALLSTPTYITRWLPNRWVVIGFCHKKVTAGVKSEFHGPLKIAGNSPHMSHQPRSNAAKGVIARIAHKSIGSGTRMIDWMRPRPLVHPQRSIAIASKHKFSTAPSTQYTALDTSLRFAGASSESRMRLDSRQSFSLSLTHHRVHHAFISHNETLMCCADATQIKGQWSVLGHQMATVVEPQCGPQLDQARLSVPHQHRW